MHDIHVANKVFQLILEYAKKSNLKIIKKVEIDLGSIVEHGANISAENLDFNLRMLGRDFFSKDIQININKVTGSDWKLISISGD
jgi:Zn finger protein HypA/HybF involved in hydrogenase expression